MVTTLMEAVTQKSALVTSCGLAATDLVPALPLTLSQSGWGVMSRGQTGEFIAEFLAEILNKHDTHAAARHRGRFLKIWIKFETLVTG